MSPYDAVVLTGGLGRRLGGVDKALLDVGGQALLERVLAAVAEARARVCVGPRRDTDPAVTWCREQPPGGGPVAALATAVPRLSADIAVVLAVDLPFVDATTVASLVVAVGDRDGAVGLDADGRTQPLLAAYRRDRLAAVLESMGDPAGARMRDLIADLDLVRVPVGAAALDCDTPEDLRDARSRVRGSQQ